jgi:hypothetical protein
MIMKTKQPFLIMLALVLLSSKLAGQAAITHYVSVNSTTPLAPYTSWGTAATVIQDAIDVASDTDTILVTNGTYATGGRAVDGITTNRAAIYKVLLVQSMNGPGVTTIQGSGSVRCAYLTNGAVLSGFTLTDGLAPSGGGVWCVSTNAVVTNCTLTGNSAASSGGGAYGGTLNNCSLSENFSYYEGGGAESCNLNNCSLGGNTAGSAQILA